MSAPLSRELDRLRNVVLRRIEYLEMTRSNSPVEIKGERLTPGKVVVAERPLTRRQRLTRFVRRLFQRIRP